MHVEWQAQSMYKPTISMLKAKAKMYQDSESMARDFVFRHNDVDLGA